MTLRDCDLYYGAVFSMLLEKLGTQISFAKVEEGTGLYCFEEKYLLYIKYSKARKGPWTFTFQPDHLLLLRNLQQHFESVLVAFVCGRDGILGIPLPDLRATMQLSSTVQESVIIRRRLKAMYSLSGSLGEAKRKFSRESLVEQFRRLNVPESRNTQFKRSRGMVSLNGSEG